MREPIDTYVVYLVTVTPDGRQTGFRIPIDAKDDGSMVIDTKATEPDRDDWLGFANTRVPKREVVTTFTITTRGGYTMFVPSEMTPPEQIAPIAQIEGSDPMTAQPDPAPSTDTRCPDDVHLYGGPHPMPDIVPAEPARYTDSPAAEKLPCSWGKCLDVHEAASHVRQDATDNGWIALHGDTARDKTPAFCPFHASLLVADGARVFGPEYETTQSRVPVVGDVLLTPDHGVMTRTLDGWALSVRFATIGTISADHIETGSAKP